MDVVTGMVSGITLQRLVKRAVVLTGLGLVLGLAACGERPGRDDEVLYTEAYPDLASIPEDKPRSNSVPRSLVQQYNAFQAQPDQAPVLAVDFDSLLNAPVLPPREIQTARGATEFTDLALSPDVLAALTDRQAQADAFFGIEEQIAQDAAARAKQAEALQARQEAAAEFERRRAEQLAMMAEQQAIREILDSPPEVEVVAGPQAQPANLGALFYDTTVGDPVAIVYFGPDSSDLGERELAILRPIADIVVRLDQNIILHGHTNGYRFTRTQAHRDQHMAISRQRAESVRDMLVTMGVPAERIQLEWFGDLRPVWAEVNGMTSQGNRRVEIFIKVPARLVTGGRSLGGN